MNSTPSVGRIVIEEAFRLIALEGVVGIPPLGIAVAMDANPQILKVVGAISLSAPLIISILMIVIRTKSRQGKTPTIERRQTRTRVWVLGLATLASILLAVLYMTRGLINQQQLIANILLTLVWVVLGGWWFTRSYLQR